MKLLIMKFYYIVSYIKKLLIHNSCGELVHKGNMKRV
jgi:hypothetical protein